jgi:hypothetical protein
MFGVLLWVFLCGVSIVCAASAQTRLFLLNPSEAAKLRLGPDERPLEPMLRGLSAGPRIIIYKPTVTQTGEGSVIETTPSTSFVISFQENGAPVDMDSLEIKARKGVFSVSLTSRLKPYIRGTDLDAELVSVPEGRFMVQIEIADRVGARTVETYRLDVKRGS